MGSVVEVPKKKVKRRGEFTRFYRGMLVKLLRGERLKSALSPQKGALGGSRAVATEKPKKKKGGGR